MLHMKVCTENIVHQVVYRNILYRKFHSGKYCIEKNVQKMVYRKWYTGNCLQESVLQEYYTGNVVQENTVQENAVQEILYRQSRTGKHCTDIIVQEILHK